MVSLNEGTKRLHVNNVRIMHDRETGLSRGFGFINVSDEDTTNQALELDGSELGGNMIKVEVSSPLKMKIP